MDYEKGLMNVFEAYFPAAEIHGCFFHLAQNVKKHVAAGGLSSRYRKEADFALAVRMIPSMAFLRLPAGTSRKTISCEGTKQSQSCSDPRRLSLDLRQERDYIFHKESQACSY